MSVMLAKLAQEQVEIEHPSFQQYRCSICGKGEHHEQMFAAHPKHLEYHGITPNYQMPVGGVYPVCSSCNAEHFHTDDELVEERKPDYSGYRLKDKSIDHQCMRCRKSLDNTEDYTWETSDFAKIHDIDLTEELLEMIDKLGVKGELPLCYDCENELEDNNETKCAACGHMEDRDEMTEMDLETINSVTSAVFKLDTDGEYPVCDDCYMDDFHERCDICSDGTIVTELESVEWPSGHSGEACESCRSRLLYCGTCHSAIDTEDYNAQYHYDENSGEVYCENHMPTNDNDFSQLDSDAESALEAINYVEMDYHIPVNSKVIQKLEKTFAYALKKYKGPYMPDKVSRHLIRIIDQLAIEPGEKKYLKEFLWYQPLEEGQPPKSPLKTDRLALLLGHTQKIQEFRSNMAENYEISKKHKYLRDLMPLPVIVSVEEPHDDSYYNSFAVTISPNNEVEETAQTVWGSDGMKVWGMMSDGTHHSGTVAYCRIGNYDGEWLIENLQSDSDVQRIKTKLDPARGYGNIQTSEYRRMQNDEEYKKHILKIARWWSRQFKGWEAFLMMLVMQMAEDAGVELYTTDTKHQKSKWGSIPDRSAIIYDAIPAELHDARMKALVKELAEFEDIPVEQVTEEMIREHVEVFPRREERSSDQTEGNEDLDRELWRLANRR